MGVRPEKPAEMSEAHFVPYMSALVKKADTTNETLTSRKIAGRSPSRPQDADTSCFCSHFVQVVTPVDGFVAALLGPAHDSNVHLGSQAEPCTIEAQARVKTCQGRETQLILRLLAVLGADGTEAAQRVPCT